jgi:hypothetical protein
MSTGNALGREGRDVPSKSPVSETTTVPVCLSWSSEVVIVLVLFVFVGVGVKEEEEERAIEPIRARRTSFGSNPRRRVGPAEPRSPGPGPAAADAPILTRACAIGRLVRTRPRVALPSPSPHRPCARCSASAVLLPEAAREPSLLSSVWSERRRRTSTPAQPPAPADARRRRGSKDATLGSYPRGKPLTYR